VPYLVVQANIDKETVHVRSQQIRADQIGQIQLHQLIARHKLVVFIDRSALLALLQLLGEVVEERCPLGRGTQRGNVERLNAMLLHRRHDQTSAGECAQTIDVGLGLNTREGITSVTIPHLDNLSVGGDDFACARMKLDIANRLLVLVVLD
jgi:hypothetical protein